MPHKPSFQELHRRHIETVRYFTFSLQHLAFRTEARISKALNDHTQPIQLKHVGWEGIEYDKAPETMRNYFAAKIDGDHVSICAYYPHERLDVEKAILRDSIFEQWHGSTKTLFSEAV